ncbi:MAG: hypothetical protein GY854_05085 [Deltaproteobacteria bacterium]|nr:hypothetical protein [Deltaproteobacteria bacterium]
MNQSLPTTQLGSVVDHVEQAVVSRDSLVYPCLNVGGGVEASRLLEMGSSDTAPDYRWIRRYSSRGA